MKTHATFPGKAYVVTSAVDCTVSTPDGVVITTHAPGNQTLFIAPTAEVVVSNDAARLTESFKGASLSVLGGGVTGGSDIVVAQSFDKTSPNAMSGVAVQDALDKRLGTACVDSDSSFVFNTYAKMSMIGNLYCNSINASGDCCIGGNFVAKGILSAANVFESHGEMYAFANFSCSGDADFSGEVTVQGSPVVTKATLPEPVSLLKPSTLSHPSGCITVNCNFSIQGVATLNGGMDCAGDAYVEGSLSVSGALGANGVVSNTISASSTDKVTCNHKFNTLDDLTERGYRVATVGYLLPVGTIIASVAASMDGWLLCDGAEYDSIDYPYLATMLYGSDVGTTFKVPDLRNRFLQGADGNLGAAIDAGLPNITGAVGLAGCAANTTGVSSGALAKTHSGTAKSTLQDGEGADVIINLDASLSNSTYGSSDTVQPPAYAVNYFIRAELYPGQITGIVGGDLNTEETPLSPSDEVPTPTV